MAVIKTGNVSHDADILAAEVVRQGIQVPGASMATMKAADIAYARTCLASSIAKNNSANAGLFIEMLLELGTGGR